MTKTLDTEKADIQEKIEHLLKQRLVNMIIALIAIGSGIISAIICDIYNLNRLIPIIIIPLLGFGFVTLARIFSSRCPACGQMFFYAPVRALYASTCYHCKAGKGTTSKPSNT